MLEDLPVEILLQVIGQLPSASDIIRLSLGSRRLHDQISADDYAAFRVFVQNKFPSITAPPFWKESARALTSRSRAWDRRAFFARECLPPRDYNLAAARRLPGQKFGYVPVIDSYETWDGSRWSDKREVLVWGAAGRLRMRTRGKGSTSWSTWRISDDHLPHQDILDVRLLKPCQQRSSAGETIVLRRANKEIVKVRSLPGQDAFKEDTRYATEPASVDAMDINQAAEPMLAICNAMSVQLFPVDSKEEVTQPSDVFHLEQSFQLPHRKRCAKFLSDDTLAVGVQFMEGRMRSPIDIYRITPDSLRRSSSKAFYSINGTDDYNSGRHCANIIVPLDATSHLGGRPGEVFLSGWTDGVARLHDLRSPSASVADYLDVVDDGQVLSLLPVGHERFLAGGHHNACLRTFDMRMPGARLYSYLDARLPALRSSSPKNGKPLQMKNRLGRFQLSSPATDRREINIFLSLHLLPARHLWQPLPRHQTRELPRYRGSVYSLSSPSPSSPTVFAGIENHVIELDFAATDDVTGRRGDEVFGLGLGLDADKAAPVLNLSCYERPRHGHESTDPILLRKQVDWPFRASRVNTAQHHHHDERVGEAESGWDERWRLATYDRQTASGPGWRVRT